MVPALFPLVLQVNVLSQKDGDTCPGGSMWQSENLNPCPLGPRPPSWHLSRRFYVAEWELEPRSTWPTISIVAILGPQGNWGLSHQGTGLHLQPLLTSTSVTRAPRIVTLIDKGFSFPEWKQGTLTEAKCLAQGLFWSLMAAFGSLDPPLSFSTCFLISKMSITGGRSRINREFGVRRCKLLNLEWINNLLCFILKCDFILKSYCIAQGTLSSLLGKNMMEDNMRKRMCIHTHTHTHDWVTCCTTEIDRTS